MHRSTSDSADHATIGNAAAGSGVVTPPPYLTTFPPRSEHALGTPTVLDTDTHVPHLINGLSLEVSRQADRIRRRTHTRDWPGAASAMTELEDTVRLLSQLVNVSLANSVAGEPAPEPEDDESALPVGQYL